MAKTNYTKAQLMRHQDKIKRIHTAFRKTMERSSTGFQPGPPPMVLMDPECWDEFCQVGVNLQVVCNLMPLLSSIHSTTKMPRSSGRTGGPSSPSQMNSGAPTL